MTESCPVPDRRPLFPETPIDNARLRHRDGPEPPVCRHDRAVDRLEPRVRALASSEDQRQTDFLSLPGVHDAQAVTPPASNDVMVSAPSRVRKLLSWIATAALGRLVSALVPLILLPVTLSYLGTELYGLWAAVIAITGMVVFADLGVGLGLMTRLAPCRITEDADTARGYVSSAYATVSAVALVACTTLWLFSGLVPWSALFNADGPAAQDARLVASICLTAFLVNIPLALVIRVQYAYQQVAVSNIWQACSSALSLPLALGTVAVGMRPVVVIAAIAFSPVLVNAVNTAWTFGRRFRHLAPSPRFIERRRMRELLSLGGLFFLVTLVMVLADNADPLIIAHVLGLGAVTTYAVPARVFGQIGALVTLVNQPIWPMHGEAVARGDVAWIRRTVRRMTVVSVLTALLPSALMVTLGNDLLSAWLPISIENRSLLLGLACWWILLAAISPRFMVQNAAGVLRPQLCGYLLYLPLSAVGKYIGLQWWGVSAAPYVAVVAYSVTVLPAALHGYQRALRLANIAPERQ
jgi:O-antigen/teichoic acid export membrane protein